MAVMVISLIFGVLVAAYFYLMRNYKYWQKRGVPCPNGVLPLVGHMWSVFCMKTSFVDYIYKIYNENRNHSMLGIYNFMSPALIVLEPELIKTVLQTKFSSFHKNGIMVDPELDPLMSHNPFASTGEKWLVSRKRFSYTFSSMRLKILLESIKPVCVTFENFLDKKLNKTGKLEVELKTLFSRYTAQVVAGAGFGVDGYCFDDEKESLSFRRIGKAILEPNTRNKIFFTIIFIMPFLAKWFKMSFVPKHIDRFFRTLVAEQLEQRRMEAIPRNDFLHLMVELERIEGNKFDVEVLASQALSFVVDGYETSSNVMSFIGYQLATHLEVQKKLREEIVSVLNKYDGMITYDALKEMTYMEQVMNESQRIIPTAGALFKICTEECELKGSDGLTCRVEPGTEILISVHGLHRDPRYWENPDVFDPDRFNPDRKQGIEKFTFLPFGEGPRICVGMRMAVLQIKAGLAAVLRKYSLELSPKTQVPLKMEAGNLLPTPKGGLWVTIRQL